MAGKTIEDILIDKDYKKVGKLNKKKNKGNKKNIFLILFLGALIVALIVLGIFAWKYIEDSRVVTSKELFLEHALDNNFSSLLENKLYEESYKKLGKENFYMDTKLNFSTTSEIEGFENFDFSKFSLDNNLIRNAADNKVYTDSIIKYLGNDIFDLKTISQADNFAINSEQIVTKYISGNTDQMNNLIKEVTGYDLNVNFGSAIVNNIATSEKIELTDKNVSSVAKKIIKNVDTILSEEDVTQKEIIIENNGEQVSTIAYTAVFDKKEVLDITRGLINELENDKIASKILTGYEPKGIFEIGDRREYNTNPDADLENIIDSSDFIAGEEDEEEVIENVVEEEAVNGTLTSTTVQDENLEYREEVPDETTIGYRPPAENINNNNNTSNNEQQSGEVINVINPNPVQNQNQNNNNNSNNNGSNGGNNNNNNNNNNGNGTSIDTSGNNNSNNNNNNNNGNTNTVQNKVTNTVQNTVANTVTNTVTNTTNGGSNISSDLVEGEPVPMGALNQSVEVVSKAGFSRRFLTDIQIIQNPNLTTEEDRIAQEENREQLKQETEALFDSITNAIESNTQIVNENEENNQTNNLLKSEYELIESILFKTKMDLTYEKYSELLDSFYTKIENHNFEKLNVTIYVANDKTLKVVIEDDNKLQIEMDYIDINENENKFKYLVLTDRESRTGYMFEVYKSQRDASCSYEVIVSWIDSGKIVEKFTTTVSSNGTSLGSNLENEIILKYVKGTEESFQVTVDNSIGFATRDIQELNDVNCLFLNSLSNEEYVAIVSAVKNKTMDVLAEKMTDLDLIDLNTGNDFVNRVQEEAENNRQEEVRNELSKDEARNLIIDRVSILMGEAEERGEEVTLDVVRGLSIDGYEVTSSVTTEEAYIVLNGHQFIINKSFTIIDLN